MKKIKWIGTITTIVGIIFMIYGWTQSFEIAMEFPVDEYKRIVRSYVFIIGGLIVVFVGIMLEITLNYIRKLENRIVGLTEEVKNK